MAIKDLSPTDNNRGGRIIKNMRICGSGIYRYHISEAPLLGLLVDEKHSGDEWIDVYRPPEVLEANKQLYSRIPIITGHHVLVNTANAKQLVVGMVGDTVLSEKGDDGETYLYTTGTIVAGDGIAAYEKYGELSVGYDPIIEWSDGVHNGKKYNAVMTGLAGVNHLLICKQARGGHQCMVMDSLDGIERTQKTEVKQMGLFKKIFAKPTEKPIAGDAKVISALLQSVKVGADAKTQIGLASSMLGDKVDETLKGYFEELSGDEVAKADKETLGKAIDVVDGYIQNLFGDEHPADCTCEECKGKVKTGDEKPTEEKSKDEKPEEEKSKDEKPSNGDAVTAEMVAKMVGDAVAKAFADKADADKKAAEKQAGDAVQKDEIEVSRLDALLAGDESTKDALTSEKLMKDIWG